MKVTHKIKVMMLAGKGESSTLIFNGIKDNFSIEKVIIEEPISKIQMLKRRAQNLGLIKVAGQIIFMGYNVWLKKISKKRIIEIMSNEKLNDEKIDGQIVSKVTSVNSEKVIILLKKIQPDVVVVNGTRVIKKEVIEAIDAPFVNTHAGITPKYRGVHGGYWALAENDQEHCGVTIHLVDTGIDTGGVLYQKAIRTTNNDTFNTYPYLQIAAAIPLMKKAIKDIADNTYKIQNVALPSKLWSHPTIFEYLKNRILHGTK